MSEYIITSQVGRVGEIILDRPAALNALNHDMCLAIHAALTQFSDDDTIHCVLIRSNHDRAFCAGGDIRAIHHLGQTDRQQAEQFFADEYAMNVALFHFSKPVVAMCDGVTMGGGVGISLHGSHPIATERTLFAMPEVKIGFYPDVGVAYQLSRLPHCYGEYLGLTGTSINGSDCVSLGLMHAMVPHADIAALITALQALDFAEGSDAHQQVDACIASYQMSAQQQPAGNLPKPTEVDACFSLGSVDAIMAVLQTNQSEWAQAALAHMQYNAPGSMALTLHFLKQARELSMDEVIAENNKLSQQCLAGQDFFEGIRALLIDKDRQPQWSAD